jgi:sporulation protein YlmC with PRC-barrel domain
MKVLQVGIATIPFLLLLPLTVFSQQTIEQPTPRQQEQPKAASPSPTEQQPAAPVEQRQQPPQPQAQQERQTEAKISVMSFADSMVVDEQGKEIGQVKDILIDSQAGRIEAVNIQMTGDRGGLFGVRDRAQVISVPWDSLTPKHKDGQLVLALRHDVLQKVQPQERTGETKQEQQKKGQQQ